MFQPSDSIPATEAAGREAPQPAATWKAHAGHDLTPAQVLERLPATATPRQQDSAIRANIKFEEVDWSRRPNPMRTPLTKADPETTGNLGQPLYHSRSLVQPDSIYRPECATYHNGVAGDPIPYTIAGDSLITGILLACFILATIAIAFSGNFLQRQVKGFFRAARQGTTEATETSMEIRFQFFLVLQTCLLFALIFFFFSRTFIGDSFPIAHYQVLGIYTGIMAAYFIAKAVLYTLVNWVFFDKKKNVQWMKAQLFLEAAEGAFVFPVVLLMAYFGLSIDSVVIYSIAVVVLTKILAFYKTFTIFFRRNGFVLQSFLYFCALELMPLGALWGVLVLTDNYLKAIF